MTDFTKRISVAVDQGSNDAMAAVTSSKAGVVQRLERFANHIDRSTFRKCGPGTKMG